MRVDHYDGLPHVGIGVIVWGGPRCLGPFEVRA